MELVKQLQKLRGIDGDGEYDNDSGSGRDVSRRKTIHNLEKHAKRKRQIGTLDVAFKRRFFNLDANSANPGTITIFLYIKGQKFNIACFRYTCIN